MDAFNLAADRRGMGRYVRSVLRGIDSLGGADIFLIVKSQRAIPDLQSEFRYPIVFAKQLKAAQPQIVWYCWNGVRFSPHAPSVATIYDPFAFSEPHPNIVARWREQAPIRRSLRQATALMTISAWSARELRSRFKIPGERITVAPPIVDTFWHPSGSHESGNPYVLLVAGPERRKNVAFFARAFDAAFAQSSVRLVIAGSLNEEDERCIADLRARTERVRPDDAQLRDLYSNALAVAVPSFAEGFGIVALEAMACGTAVLAADAAALPEACGGAALLLPAHDRDAWVDALRAVHSEAALREDLCNRALARAALIDPLAPARTFLSVASRLAA